MKSPLVETLKQLLYQAVRELEYVQSVENCHSGLCASAVGKELIEKGMRVLGVKDLAAERLVEQTIAKGEDAPKVHFPIAHCSNPKCDHEFSMEHMALGLPGVAWQCPKCYGRDYHCEVTIAAKGEEPREPAALLTFREKVLNICLGNEIPSEDIWDELGRLCKEWNVRVTEPKE